MSVSFHPGAEEDLLQAIAYYEQQEAGLGRDFAGEIAATILQIQNHPKAWPLLEGDIRRCLVNRFPFGVLYSIEPEEVFVLAVMHLRRMPDFWKERA